MKLCNVKKMMSKAILTMALIGIGLLMSAFSRGRVMMVSAAETMSANNTVDVKVVPVQGDLVKKEQIYQTEGTEQMLFAGWFTDEGCVEGVTKDTVLNSASTYYAKFVDSKILGIKLQLRQNADDTADMRIVSSVDCLEYQSVGFDIYFYSEDKKTYTHVPFKTSTVQKRIRVTEEGVAYDFSPKVIDGASKYFVSATIKKVAVDNQHRDFYIKPYWITTSGVKVYGQSRYLSTEDGLSTGNINIPIEMENPNQTTIAVQVNNTTVDAEVAYYEEERGWAHLNIPVENIAVENETINDRTKLPTATNIQISDNVHAVFRNYINATTEVDTSWYAVDTSANEFVIATEADLKGLACLVNDGTDFFQNDTVILVGNVIVNEGTVAENLSSWEQWTPIGTAEDGKRFSGTFDADNNTISGIYMMNTEVMGLFGGTETGSVIQNLRLKESCFSVSDKSTYKLGSIVADCHGNLDNVYSDAVMNSAATKSGTDMRTGGLVATLDAWDYQNNCAGTINVTNCWYEGSITLGNNTRYAGGITGDITRGIVKMDNCLFTGIIYDGNTLHSIDYVGGFFGDISESPHETVLEISSSISAGEVLETMDAIDQGAGVGAIGGYFSFPSDAPDTYNSVTLKLTNVFSTRECHAKVVSNGSTPHILKDENGEDILDANGNQITAQTLLEGNTIWSYNNDRLVGYCKELTGESLNFTEDWVLRTEGVPIPQTMEDVVELSSIVENNVSLEKQTGLDTLGVEVSAATNMGMGNYVHTITGKTYEDYQDYLATLKNLEFEAYVGEADGTTEDDGTAIDGVYNAVYVKEEGKWVISTTYVENMQSLYVTIHTGGADSLSPHLIYDEDDEDRNINKAGKVTFTMSQLTTGDKTGNQFIFRLPNGHFIINDGGYGEEVVPLLEKLKETVHEEGATEVYIDAWIISHQHGDHAGVFYGINTAVKDKKNVENLFPGIYVEGIYLSEPNYQTQLAEGMHTSVTNQYRGMRWLTNSDGERTPIYRYNTGQRYYFSGVSMDVIQSQEVLPIHDKTVWAAEGLENSVSTTFVYTTNNGEKIFWSGDATHLNTDYIMKAYGSLEEGSALSALLYGPKSSFGAVFDEGTLSVDSLEKVVTGEGKNVTKNSQMLSDITIYITPHHGTNTTLPFSNWLATDYGRVVGERDEEGEIIGKFDTILFPNYRFNMTGLESLASEENYVAEQQEAQNHANQWLIENLIEGGSVRIDEENDIITVTGKAYHYGEGPIILPFEKIDTSEGEDTDEPNWSLPF